MTRVAVVDLGSNSTRLLVADVGDDGSIVELEKRSTVTRLGQGVDRAGVLADEAIGRVRAVLGEYRAAIDALGADAALGVLTSAVRDAANGDELTGPVRDEFGIDARVITGEEEARLTYLGAISEQPHDDATTTLVIDIGGGSTELVVGRGERLVSHASTQVGVVRHTERHLSSDPPADTEVAALRAEVADVFAGHASNVDAGIAVAGTATSCAAILLARAGSDPGTVEGFVLARDAVAELLALTAAMPLAQRRALRGLDPERAPTIVAGVIVLHEAMLAFGLDQVTVSEHDILRGVALRYAQAH